jgi:hypothetical protein
MHGVIFYAWPVTHDGFFEDPKKRPPELHCGFPQARIKNRARRIRVIQLFNPCSNGRADRLRTLPGPCFLTFRQ